MPSCTQISWAASNNLNSNKEIWVRHKLILLSLFSMTTGFVIKEIEDFLLLKITSWKHAHLLLHSAWDSNLSCHVL